jgi:MFS superfamily sulfate permease-like transporter
MNGLAIFGYLVLGLCIGVVIGFIIACILLGETMDDYEEENQALIIEVNRQDALLNFYSKPDGKEKDISSNSNNKNDGGNE